MHSIISPANVKARLKKTLKPHNSAGFTIIEVLIVLAIAGLILLIVFLAVPSLQRSIRNRQRSSDASALLAAIQECLSSRNNQAKPCRLKENIPLDASSDFSIFSDFNYGLAVLPSGALPPTPPSGTYPGNPEMVGKDRRYYVAYQIGTACNEPGSYVSAGPNKTSVHVAYWIETASGPGIGRCIGTDVK